MQSTKEIARQFVKFGQNALKSGETSLHLHSQKMGLLRK
jgi:hypothetical protein